MASQSITSFKEEGKIYIVIENPSRETEKAIDDLFGDTAISLAGVFKPVEQKDTKAEAESIKTKAPAAHENITEQSGKEMKVKETVDKTEADRKPASKDISHLTPAEAKDYLVGFLKAKEKNPNLVFKPADILTALFIFRNRLDGVKEIQEMGPEKAKHLWITKNMFSHVVHYTGYDWKGDKVAMNDGWV